MTKAPRLRMLGNRVGTVANRMAPGPKVAAPLLKQSVYRKQKVLPRRVPPTGSARARPLLRYQLLHVTNKCFRLQAIKQ